MEKRDAVGKYLFRNGYTIAVTTDYFDWVWDGAFYRCDSRQDKKATEWLKSHIIDSADRQLRSTNLASERLLHLALRTDDRRVRRTRSTGGGAADSDEFQALRVKGLFASA